MEYGKLGTKFATDPTNPEEENEYIKEQNPLLIQDVPNVNPTGGSSGFMNPMNFATREAATLMAGVFGGKVVQDPATVNWTTGPYKAFAIKTSGPKGFTINAGNIATVLGNDIAYPNAARKSEVISTELIVGGELDETIAERLWVAIQPLLPKQP